MTHQTSTSLWLAAFALPTVWALIVIACMTHSMKMQVRYDLLFDSAGAGAIIEAGIREQQYYTTINRSTKE